MQLAFIAAIQELPPRQRAVLLLRDVLGWSASETAHLLEGSQASVNSALQRARATLEVRFPRGQPSGLPATDLRQRALLERYVKAWESADPDGLVALVREDAVLRMPPNRAWYRGRAAIKAFFGWVWRPQGYGPFRLLTTAANSQPAFAAYVRDPLDATYRAHGIHVLTLADDRLSVLTIFRDPRLFQVFGLPAVLSADSVPVAGPRT